MPLLGGRNFKKSGSLSRKATLMENVPATKKLILDDHIQHISEMDDLDLEEIEQKAEDSSEN